MNSYKVVDRCDFRPGDRVDQRYLVRKSLGEGSFGAVYLVEDGGRKYALKLLRLWEVPAEIRQPLMDRFEMEFKTGQIDCDNLVRSLGFGIVGGNPYIIMEFCPGGDLQPLIGKSPERMPSICQDILVGLNALHVRGKVHRDLKPENVLFKENGKAALTDFGIAGDRTHRMTQRNIFGKPNQIFGTYAYMPPEQVTRARGGATVLPTTDIFSFGVLAYQLLTGKLPFGTLESHNDLAEYQRRGKDGLWDRDALRYLNNGQQWERVINGCLTPDFKERLQTVNDVLSLLPRPSGGYNNNSYGNAGYNNPGGYGNYNNAGYGNNGGYSNKVSNVYPQQGGMQQPQMQQAYCPSSQPRGYQLRILQGEEYGKIYNLSELVGQGRRLMTIGRVPDNTIFIKSDHSDFMSRYHCTLEVGTNGGQWAIRDGQWRADQRQWLCSSNGTYVNSKPVNQNGFFLQAGDIITAGDVTMRFENY
ncbi:MAG: protein kinase [Prevotella sp.]|nr:protein kinase [Prevotella sp.]